jgi:rhodanese-related sulfurtransferase/glyoxylase-like metal-dependent hydrolase (beta-lactamase superfamily II)
MKIITLLLLITNVFALNFDAQLAKINTQIDNINTDELLTILDNNPHAVLIDVRTEREIEFTGTINRGQNINIPRGWLEFRVDEYDKDTEIITYCGQNIRSPLAAKRLMDMGFTNVKNYSDGYFAWKDRQLPLFVYDNYKNNYLYNEVEQVAEGVWTAIGAAQPATLGNAGHNNNLSFIIGEESVLVFNAGGSYLLAKAMHEEIKKITTKPIKYVVLENAQGHAILGSDYWQQQGATIIAHKLADEEIQKHGDQILERAISRIGKQTQFTKIFRPHKTFEKAMDIDLGGLKVELKYLGASHSPDDIQLWIPSKKILISGDTAFNVRMLPVFEHTNISEWIKTWDKVENLNPKIVIPGHGGVTDLQTTTKFTKGYLSFMEKAIINLLDNDGGLSDAYKIDQSQFRDWGTYRELHLRNAARVFKQMEFDY